MSAPPHGPSAIRLGVWQLAWPTAVSVLLQMSVSFVDFLFVSELGADAVAGLGAGFQLLFLQFAMFQAVTGGTTAIVARARGAGDLQEVDGATRMSVLLILALGAVGMCLSLVAAPMLRLFDFTEPVVAAGAIWLSTMLLFSIPMGASMTMDFASRAAGDVRTPLLIGTLVNVVNAVLDYGLIFGKFGLPAMGIRGAALASGLAMCLGFVVWAWLWSSNRVAMRRVGGRSRMGMNMARRLFRVGIPTAAESATFDLGLLLFVSLVVNYGTPAVSAYFIGARILFFCFVPGVAFSVASSTLVGQHLGAGEPEHARAAGWRATRSAVVTMSVIGAVLASLAGHIAGWFAATGPETVALTVRFVYILGVSLPFIAVEFALAGALRGAGDTRFPLITVLTGLVGVRLMTAWVVVHLLGGSITMLWCCLIGDYAIKALMLSLRFRSNAWGRVRV